MSTNTIHTVGALLPDFFTRRRAAGEPFRVGQRVRSSYNHTDTGTVIRHIRQQETDDLYVVAWDDHPYDRDMYAHFRLEDAA